MDRIPAPKRVNKAGLGALCVAALFLAAPLLVYPLGLGRGVSPGFFVFLSWAAVVVAAVLYQRLVAWAVLSLVPLCGLAWMTYVDWRFFIADGGGYGFYPWGMVALFTGTCLVVAGSGTLSVVLAASGWRAEASHDRPASGSL